MVVNWSVLILIDFLFCSSSITSKKCKKIEKEIWEKNNNFWQFSNKFWKNLREILSKQIFEIHFDILESVCQRFWDTSTLFCENYKKILKEFKKNEEENCK